MKADEIVINKTVLLLSLILMLLFIGTTVASVEISNVSYVSADNDNWCWAAILECVLGLSGYDVVQGDLQTWVNQQKDSCWYYNVDSIKTYFDCDESKQLDCCNKTNILTSTTVPGCVDDILTHYFISNTYMSSILPYDVMKDNINSGNPFIMGCYILQHFLLGYGYDFFEGEYHIKIMDPKNLPDGGMYTETYNGLAGYYTEIGWWETLICEGSYDVGYNEDPYAKISEFKAIKSDNQVKLLWDTKWEKNSKYFIVQKKNGNEDGYKNIRLVDARVT